MESTAKPELTGRQVEMLKALERGLTTPEAAKEMDIATTTAYSMIGDIYIRLGVETRIAAINKAKELELL